jgi:uncharacterized protein DUF1570
MSARRAGRVPITILRSLLLQLAASPLVAGVAVHPVPLQKSDCAAAPGASPFTGHALFEYRIETTGAVQGIKLLYSDVQPADRKPGFVAEATTCLEKWKFKPATVDGIPAATVMKVAFHRLPPGPKDEEKVMLPGGRIVPKSLLAQVRVSTLAFTETLLKGKDYKEAKGNGWLVRTDLPKASLDDLQEAIEFAQRVVDEAFPGPAGGAGKQDVTLILFKDEEEYRQLSAFDNVIPERAPVAGQYDSQFRMIYSALGDRPLQVFARTMAHEATHHFASQRLGGANGAMPRWLGEGIAQYVECVKMAKPGKVRLEALDRGQVEQQTTLMMRGDRYRGAFIYRKRAESALSNLQENLSQVDLAALLDGRLEQHFFDEGAQTLYDVSWLLVHYLMNADGRQHRDLFRKWAADAAAPRSADSLAAIIGISVGDLQPRLQAYLAQIK